MLPLFDYEIIAFEMYSVRCALPRSPFLSLGVFNWFNDARDFEPATTMTTAAEVDRLLFGLISHHSKCGRARERERGALCLQCRIFFGIVFSAHFTC